MEDLATAEISRTQIYQMRKNNIKILTTDKKELVNINTVFDNIFDEEARRIMTNGETVKFDTTPVIEKLENEKQSLSVSDKQYDKQLLTVQQKIDKEREDCLVKFSSAIKIVKNICDPNKPLDGFLSHRIYPNILEIEAIIKASKLSEKPDSHPVNSL